MIRDRLLIIKIMGLLLLIGYIGFIVSLAIIDDLPKNALISIIFAGFVYVLGSVFTHEQLNKYQKMYNHQIIYEDLRYQLICSGANSPHKTVILSQLGGDFCLNGIPLVDPEIYTFDDDNRLGIRLIDDSQVYWYRMYYVEREIYKGEFLQYAFMRPDNYE